MHFSGDFTLGNLLTIVTLVGIAVTFGRKLGAFEVTLKSHADALLETAHKLAEHDAKISAVLESLSRFGSFETSLKSYAVGLEAVADRLNKHEDRILDVVTSLQRLMGQSEIMFRRADERNATK